MEKAVETVQSDLDEAQLTALEGDAGLDATVVAALRADRKAVAARLDALLRGIDGVRLAAQAKLSGAV